MDPEKTQGVFLVFFAVWALLCLGSAGFFLFNRNASLKRRVLPPLLIFTGLVFLGFMLLMCFPPEVFTVAVPMIVLITLLNMRAIRFCDACGRTLHSQNPFSAPKFCSKCGAQLGA
jgi:hypothetical protein